MSENINQILQQLGDSPNNELTLSDLVSVIHKSLVYSQHSVRDIELEELKRQYNVNVDESTETILLSNNNISINDNSHPQSELTKQNSLTINTTNIKMKVNLGNIIERDNKKEVLISKYNESEPGISTELDILLQNDTNLTLSE